MSTKNLYNAAPDAPRPDKNLRCNTCAVSKGTSYGEPRVGTLWIYEVIRVKGEGDLPSRDIGSVMRCGNPRCSSQPVVKLWKAAADLDIEMVNIFRLVKACRGVPTFTLPELYAGELARVEIPDSIAALLDKGRPAPEFGKPYDPDAHIEPKPGLFCEEVPF